jgi:hypothetical protein
MSSATGRYLKKHTETLVKAAGIERAASLTGKSKATLGRYYSEHDEHADRFMPIETVALLEHAVGYPHVTAALAELAGASLQLDDHRHKRDNSGGVNADIIALSQRFAMLMWEYQQSTEDGQFTVAEAKRLFKEATLVQQVLVDMKLHLEREHGGA